MVQRVADSFLDDIEMAVAGLRSLALTVNQSKPLGMSRESLLVVQAEPGMAYGDGRRPAHAVVMIPLLEFLGARGVVAEAVPDMPRNRKARVLALVEIDAAGFLLGDNFPG